MPWTAWLPAVVLAWASPEAGEEHGVVELGIAAELLYPPAVKDPRAHPTWGAAISASIPSESSFKAMVGFAFEHVVLGWLGDPEKADPIDAGPWAGTQPKSFRGQLMRMTPQARMGIENEVAYGYFGVNAGYALRVADLVCDAACRTHQAVDHGLGFGLSLGALVTPSMKYGIVLGGEVGLDWAWFPKGHPSLATWTQGMSARAIVGWRF